MTEKYFRTLLQKHEKGTCSKEELQVLHDFCKHVQVKNLIASWDLDEKEATRVRLIKRIRQTINVHDKQRRKTMRNNTLRVISAAAIVLLLIGVINYQDLLGKKPERIVDMAQYKDEITLRLADGRIVVLNDSVTSQVHDNAGQLVCNQLPAGLVYDAAPTDDGAQAYNELRVPYGKRFKVMLSDKSTVHLNAGSSLRFPVSFTGKETRDVFLQGEGFFEVSKDSRHPFIVNNNDLDIKVLGTAFNVSTYTEDNHAEIVLVEGSVELTRDAVQARSGFMLTPGNMAIYDRHTGSIRDEEVNTEYYTSWLSGRLIFRNSSLSHIFESLERTYNVDLQLPEAHTYDEVRLNTNIDFKNESIREVLLTLQAIHPFDFKIIDNTNILINLKSKTDTMS